MRTFASIMSNTLWIGCPRAEELDAGELQPFLPDVDGVGRPRAGVLAADLGPVRLVRREGDELAVEEDRHDQRDVGEVRAAAAVRIVRHDDVALFEPARPEFRDRRLHGESHRPQEAADAVALRHQLPVLVGQPAAVVEHLVDDRTLARPLQGNEHLVPDRVQRLLDDLDRERIDGGLRTED